MLQNSAKYRRDSKKVCAFLTKCWSLAESFLPLSPVLVASDNVQCPGGAVVTYDIWSLNKTASMWWWSGHHRCYYHYTWQHHISGKTRGEIRLWFRWKVGWERFSIWIFVIGKYWIKLEWKFEMFYIEVHFARFYTEDTVEISCVSTF